MAHLRAGDLDRQLIIRSFMRGKDRTGAVFSSWGNDVTVWANKRVLSVEAKNLDNQNMPISDVEFHIYYDTNLQIDQNSQLVCDGVTYQMVGAPIEMGRREWMKIKAKAHIFAKEGGV